MNVLNQIEGGARRLADIVRILGKYGVAEWLNDVDASWIERRLLTQDGEHLIHRSTPERLRMALTELGTTGIKLGQMLSTRGDLVGSELANELSELQSHTPADPFESIEAILKEELGEAEYTAAFSKVDPVPLASASIAQVHRATLLDGTEVVLKVMHKGIEERVHRDLDLLGLLADLMERHSPSMRQYRPVSTARQFRRTLLRELDFGYELMNLQRFTRVFEDDPTVHFPCPFPELSTRRVLTMEFLKGVPVSDSDGLKNSGEDLDEFARRGANMYLEMIFRDGIYHADPHPGNVFMLPGNVVGIVDCGMIGHVDDVLREEVESLILAGVERDSVELADIICRVGLVPPRLDRIALQAELSEIVNDYGTMTLDQFDFGGALTRITDLIRRYHIILPDGFALLFKTLVMIEGTARQINPTFSMDKLMRPYHDVAVARRLHPRRVIGRMAHTYRDWRRMIEGLPRDVTDLMGRARDGTLEIHLEHRSLEGTVDRLVEGLLCAALLLASTTLLASDIEPTIHGLSVFGLLGLLGAIVLGIRILFSIHRSQKRRDREK